MGKNELGITVTKADDIVEWYGQVVLKSEMADYSAVKGCAVIRPWGFSVWQSIINYFNTRLDALGVKNAYFPLFIPESFFQKESDHVEGFAPELAWIERKDDKDERIAVRPTSETIMYDSYGKWIRSHRDLPLKINQWANVVRWEVSDVKLFLRSREFLWQEGHNAFATKEEAEEDAKTMIHEYKKLSEELLAVPAVFGLKSEREKFPGAIHTYTIESFMPDGKALQAGTSHHLSQNFAKSFDISFRGEDEQTHYVHQTSWGISTRLLGSLVMTHGDDKGLVLPPRVAPIQIVIIPITIKKNPEASTHVLQKASDLYHQLKAAGLRVELDDRDEYSPGFKYGHWELKGVPLRLELGPRDLENNSCVLAKRSGGKESVALADVTSTIETTLGEMQKELLLTARKRMQERKAEVRSYEEFKQATMLESKYVLAPHCGEAGCEETIKTDTGGVTTRCRPQGEDNAQGMTCIKCGNKAAYKIIFSRNY